VPKAAPSQARRLVNARATSGPIEGGATNGHNSGIGQMATSRRLSYSLMMGHFEEERPDSADAHFDTKAYRAS
jgi:hypothetical protein